MLQRANGGPPRSTGEAAGEWTRRDFLRCLGVLGFLGVGGCAINPVTQRPQFILFGSDEELRIDREYSPHQISADFGVVRDPALNAYVSEVGQSLTRVSHRPAMPYTFQVVQASYVNAYAFPGGTIAVTRGILLELGDEAQLAALLGHEIGHVCARHTAARLTKALVAQLALTGLALAAARRNEDEAALALGLGGIGAGLLLARYSREDERQADELGMTYAVRAGYPAQGMVDLMDVLRRLSRREPTLIERMFSSHPMSEERYQTAVARAQQGEFAASASLPRRRERYLDATARLRAQKPIVEAIQAGDRAMQQRQLHTAIDHYARAVAQGEDYEALLKLSACQFRLGQPAEAHALAERARAIAPEEPQWLHARGRALVALRRYDAALADFTEYERRLPGNPYTVFYQGRCYEGMGRRPEAIECYRRFLATGAEGEEAEYARRRLREWGVAAT